VGVALLLVRRKFAEIPVGRDKRYLLCQLCALYYYVWTVLLPKIGGYEMREEAVELDDGTLTSRLVRRHIRRPPGEERPLLASSPGHD
jgi:hypothetical protein